LHQKFLKSLKEGPMLSGTILGDIAKEVTFNIFHNSKSSASMIQDAAEIPKTDSRFLYTPPDLELSRQIRFAKGASFFKGCIQIIGKRNT
jgi:hypothetical protein